MAFPRKQIAVYWPPAGQDGFGGRTYGAAAEIAVRWEDRCETFVDSSGKSAVSRAVVYPDRLLVNEGLLFLGVLSSLASGEEDDPFSVVGIHEIRSTQTSPSLKADKTLHKVWL